MFRGFAKGALSGGALIASLLTPNPMLAQGRIGQVVHITSESEDGVTRQEGHGIFGRSGVECLLLTPKHVIQFKEEDAARVLVKPSNGPATTAEITKVSGIVDLALLKVQISECPDSPPAVAAQEVLRNAISGFLSLSTPSGGENRFFVRITGFNDETIELQPDSSGESFQQGMSGALLMGQQNGGGFPIGMVLNASGRNARALRLDKIRELEPSFWSTAATAANVGGGSSGPRISTLPKHNVEVSVRLKSQQRPDGRTWDDGFPTVFRGPDPFVFVKFSDGSASLMGFPNVTELSAVALQPLGMLWYDVCANKFFCKRSGSQVFGEAFEEVVVFDYDPTINSLPSWEVIGRSTACRLNQVCDVGGAVVLIKKEP